MSNSDAASQTQLSPPWFTIWNEIKHSLENDPAVTVGELDTSQNPYIVPISVSDDGKAVTIASIINPEYIISSTTVAVQVKNSSGEIVTPVVPGSVEELVQMVQTALTGNSLFVEVVQHKVAPNLPVMVYPIFSKSVIQFFNDDLTDLYSNYNNVAAFVFRDVLLPEPGGIRLTPSTVQG